VSITLGRGLSVVPESQVRSSNDAFRQRRDFLKQPYRMGRQLPLHLALRVDYGDLASVASLIAAASGLPNAAIFHLAGEITRGEA
jgi:hypothetical protein